MPGSSVLSNGYLGPEKVFMEVWLPGSVLPLAEKMLSELSASGPIECIVCLVHVCNKVDKNAKSAVAAGNRALRSIEPACSNN
jgi:hypothetical protein